MKLAGAIYQGLTNIGQSLERSKQTKLDHELESIKLGLVSDTKKIQILKQDLYRNLRVGKETEELRKAIALLRREINEEAEEKQLSASTFLHTICNILGVVGMLLLAHRVVFHCPSNNSRFCKLVNDTKEFIWKDDYFRILPSNIKE